MMHDHEHLNHINPYKLFFYQIISKPFDLFTNHQVLEY
jgi:hypothetical protein